LNDQGFAFKSKLNSGLKLSRPLVRYRFVNNAGSPNVKYGTGEIPLLVNCKLPLIKVGDGTFVKIESGRESADETKDMQQKNNPAIKLTIFV